MEGPACRSVWKSGAITENAHLFVLQVSGSCFCLHKDWTLTLGTDPLEVLNNSEPQSPSLAEAWSYCYGRASSLNVGATPCAFLEQ